MQKALLAAGLLILLLQESKGQSNTASSKPDFYRPQYHFSAPKNWINDPNGLLYANGEYHLFYQHNPYANVWGHMSWGHAISRDLLHWQSLPLALAEFTHPYRGQQKAGTAIFSGSAVMDYGNQSKLCPTGTKECMVAIYTGNVTEGNTHLAQYQNVASSADQGRTWTQYANNPVLDLKTKEFRDPNVFWYAPQKKWVMAAVKATEHRVVFYSSTNLKDWSLLSHFGPLGDTSRVWECPALLSVPVVDKSGRAIANQSRWVLFVSAGHPQQNYLGMQYFVGDFDGTTFTLDQHTQKPIAPAVTNVVDYGKDYYAAIPFNDLPSSQTKPVMLGWLNDWEYADKLPTTPFKGAMSLPRQISLKQTTTGLQLIQQPVNQLKSLRGERLVKQAINVDNQRILLEKSVTNVYELALAIKLGSAKTVGVRLAKNGDEETIVQYTRGKLQLDRRHSGNVAFSDRFSSVEEAPLDLKDGTLTLHLFVDNSIVEVYANDGERVITDLIFPNESTGAIELFAEGGTAEFSRVTLTKLQSTLP